MHDRLKWWNDYESNTCLCKKTHKRKFEKKIERIFLTHNGNMQPDRSWSHYF